MIRSNFKHLRNKLDAASCKLQAVKAKLLALGFLLTSIGAMMGLLWRRSIQVWFSIASSFHSSFQVYLKSIKNIQPKINLVLAALGFKQAIYHFRLVAFSVLFLACSISSHAQNPPPIDTVVSTTDSANVYYDDSTKIESDNQIDTTKIDSKKIMAAIIFLSEDSIKSLRRSKGFGYMAFIDSLLKAKEAAKKKQPEKVPKKIDASQTSVWDLGFVKVLCWMVAIGVVAFVLYKLFLGQGNAFSSNAKNNIPQVDLYEEPDMDDLDGQLKKAIQQGNYRLATRYLFLKTLQQLSNKNAISLSTEKTNIQYSQELRGKPYADSFARLCLLYEYVWFGEFSINEAQFATIQQQQQQLAKAI